MREAPSVKILHFFNSSLHIGRSSGRVTILLMGKTGQGKSRTINKLAGAPLLKTGGDESTTKEVQRVKIPVVHQGVAVELALDDTPGFDDAAVRDRDRNAVIFHRYCERFSLFTNEQEVNELVDFLHVIGCSEFVPTFRSTLRLAAFPNLIMLVTTWKSIQRDTKNEPHEFQSPIGRTIWTLLQSGLYDAHRPNVIVVVTGPRIIPSKAVRSNVEISQNLSGQGFAILSGLELAVAKNFPICPDGGTGLFTTSSLSGL